MRVIEGSSSPRHSFNNQVGIESSEQDGEEDFMMISRIASSDNSLNLVKDDDADSDESQAAVEQAILSKLSLTFLIMLIVM